MEINYVESSQLDCLIDLFICPQDRLQSYHNNPSPPQILKELLESSLKTSSSSSLAGVDQQNPSQALGDGKTQITRAYQQIQTHRGLDENQSKSINKKQQQNSNKVKSKWKDKNSNTIKKIGRIILDHLSQYNQIQEQNTSLKSMMNLLSNSKNKVVLEQYKKRDRFNTQHRKELFNSSNLKLMSFNLMQTQRLLCKHLRKVVMKSEQIKESSKLIYLNTMKCSALRCANPKLAIRLQMSNQSK